MCSSPFSEFKPGTELFNVKKLRNFTGIKLNANQVNIIFYIILKSDLNFKFLFGKYLIKYLAVHVLN